MIGFFITPLGRTLTMIGAACLLVILTIAGVHREGQKAERRRNEKVLRKNYETARKVDRAVDSLPPGSAHDRLRKDWARG